MKKYSEDFINFMGGTVEYWGKFPCGEEYAVYKDEPLWIKQARMYSKLKGLSEKDIKYFEDRLLFYQERKKELTNNNY